MFVGDAAYFINKTSSSSSSELCVLRAIFLFYRAPQALTLIIILYIIILVLCREAYRIGTVFYTILMVLVDSWRTPIGESHRSTVGDSRSDVLGSVLVRLTRQQGNTIPSPSERSIDRWRAARWRYKYYFVPTTRAQLFWEPLRDGAPLAAAALQYNIIIQLCNTEHLRIMPFVCSVGALSRVCFVCRPQGPPAAVEFLRRRRCRR